MTDLERERFMFFKLDEQDRLLVVHGHELALCVPRQLHISQGLHGKSEHSQSTAIETRHEIGYALAFNTDIGRQDIIAYGQSSGNDDNL